MTLEGKKNNSTELLKMLLLATLLQTEAKPNEAAAGCLGYHPLVTPQHELLARTAPQVGTPVCPQIEVLPVPSACAPSLATWALSANTCSGLPEMGVTVTQMSRAKTWQTKGLLGSVISPFLQDL